MKNKNYTMILAITAGIALVACTNDDATPEETKGMDVKVAGDSMTMGSDSLLTPKDAAPMDNDMFMQTIAERGWKFAKRQVVLTPYSPKPEANFLYDDPALDFCITGGDMMEYAECNGSQSIFYMMHTPYTYDADKASWTVDREWRRETYTILNCDEKRGTLTLLRQTKSKMSQSIIYYEELTYNLMKENILTEKAKAYENSPLRIEFDTDGIATAPNRQQFSDKEFNRYITGHGWKYLEAHRVLRDGKLETDDYYSIIDGGGPTYYYFGDNEATLFFYVDAIPEDCYLTLPYQYSDNRINWRWEPLSVLSYDKDTSTLALLKQSGNLTLLMFYQRMTDKELQQVRKIYKTNYNELNL